MSSYEQATLMKIAMDCSYEQDPHLYIHFAMNEYFWDLWCGSKGEWTSYDDWVAHRTELMSEVNCPHCLDAIVRFGELAATRIIEIDNPTARR